MVTIRQVQQAEGLVDEYIRVNALLSDLSRSPISVTVQVSAHPGGDAPVRKLNIAPGHDAVRAWLVSYRATVVARLAALGIVENEPGEATR